MCDCGELINCLHLQGPPGPKGDSGPQGTNGIGFAGEPGQKVNTLIYLL